MLEVISAMVDIPRLLATVSEDKFYSTELATRFVNPGKGTVDALSSEDYTCCENQDKVS